MRTADSTAAVPLCHCALSLLRSVACCSVCCAALVWTNKCDGIVIRGADVACMGGCL